MRRRTGRKLIAAAIIALALLAVVTLALWRRGSVSPYEFLRGQRPVLYTRFSGFAITIYCFRGELEEIIPEASTELASLGYAKSPCAEHEAGGQAFAKQAGRNFAQIIISSAKLLDESTATRYCYEGAPDWVSVHIVQTKTPWRHYLSRASAGLIPPPPPNPPISRTFSSGPMAEGTTRQSQ